MNLFRAAVIGLLTLASAGEGLGASSTVPPPDQAQVLDAARAYAAGYTDRLPNFICSQITTRSRFSQNIPLASIQPHRGTPAVIAQTIPSDDGDRIVERLTYFNQTENYTVVSINGRPAPGVDHLQLSGAISVGEFGTALHDIFDPSAHTDFSWHEASSVHGRRVYVYQFHVPKEAGIEIRDTMKKADVIVGYDGSVDVDPASGEVLRMTSTLDLPPGLSITAGERSVDYEPVTIADKKYTLPVRSEVMLQNGDARFDNKIEFKDYRKFGAESTIHYGDPSASGTP